MAPTAGAMPMTIRLTAAVLALFVGATTAARAAAEATPILALMSRAEVRVRPDTAEIQAGVVTQEATAGAAIAANSVRMVRVVAALKRSGVAARDIQTAQFTLEPQYRYDKDQPPRLIAYQVSNRVRVVLRDTAAAGAVIDALAAEGANQIDGPTFGVSNPGELLDRAREQAVRDGMARARLYATAAGLKIRRLIAIEETSAPAPQPMPRAMAMVADAKISTPVDAGEIPLGVAVAMRFELE
jgi:uncharacterized protein YggE